MSTEGRGKGGKNRRGNGDDSDEPEDEDAMDALLLLWTTVAPDLPEAEDEPVEIESSSPY